MTDRAPQDETVSQATERMAWIDAARGIGIILVVIGHVSRGLVSADVPHPTWLVTTADFVIYSFHMPLFFLLSGLWLGGIEKAGRKMFLLRRVYTVAYPYFLWSIIQGALIIAAGTRVNSPLAPAELAMIWLQPIGQFWFLYVLMMCHILGTLLFPRRIVMIIVAVALFLGAGFLPGVLEPFAHQFIFYLLGWLVAPWLLRHSIPNRFAAAVGAAATIGFAVCCWLAMMVTTDAETIWAFPAAVLGIVAAICGAVLSRRFSLLVFLGSASMTIYVLHIIAASGVRVVLGMGPFQPGFAIHLIIGVAMGVLGPALVHLIGQRLGWLPLFGLAPPARKASHGPILANGNLNG